MKMFQRLIVCLFVFLISISATTEQSFLPQFAGQQTVDGVNSVAVTFSKVLDSRQDLNTYLSIFKSNNEPVEGAWVLSEDFQVVYFTNVEADKKYVVRIYKGLKAKDGSKLVENFDFKVKTRQVEPTISFDSRGFILATDLNRGLPVNTVNIDKADIDFFRVKPSYHATFSRQFGRHAQMNYYQSRKLKSYADLVYTGRWDFEINKDLRTPVNIPITHIKELKKPGIYFAVLRGAGHYEYSNSTTWFTITDLGLHLRTYKEDVQIHVQSFTSGKPVKGVTINGFGSGGKLLAEAVSDSKGICRITGQVSKLKYVVAVHKNNITYVPMDIPAVDLSEFKTATQLYRPVEFFVYGPRDLYRPGEKVIMDGLLRNQDGDMTAALPLKAGIVQPDGRTVHEFKWKGTGFNYFHYEYQLPSDAITGKWRVRLKHSTGALKEYTFTVAEFLPERMKLSVDNPDGQSDLLDSSDIPEIDLKGDFLYGAPASGSKADASIQVTPARELFKEKWPGYEFGDISDQYRQSFDTDQIRLDKAGKGRLILENQWKETKSPLWLVANASLYDSGGRPVVRTKKWQIWPKKVLVGIRTLAKDNQGDARQINANSLARFEIIAVDKKGQKQTAKNLKVVVIREHREYYWEYRHGRWQWHFTSQSYPIDRFKVDIPDNGTAEINIPVKWGGYRLEVTHPETGLISSQRIWAGWHPDSVSAQGGANRPDRVDLVLDKPAYTGKDRVKVSVKAPEGGTGYLFVEADTNLLTIPVDIPVQGKTIEFEMDPTWNRHDLYVSAVIVRKGRSLIGKQAGHLPKRSVGLIHLPLDRLDRKLSIDIEAPEKTEPNQTIEVGVRIKPSGNENPGKAWVTLAAVDMGILNLTGYKTPSPHDYFFQARQYGSKIHDVYQRLIEPNKGEWAAQRFGGDAPTLSRGGDRPSTDVQIVAISRQAIAVDETGMARFKLDLPDFNGSVRLMAVAHTSQAFGSASQEMTIASPLVTQITMPRFLSMGDKAHLAIDLHNMTDERQTLNFGLDTQGPVTLISDPTNDQANDQSSDQPNNQAREITLEKGERHTTVFPVFSQNRLGSTKINLSVKGLWVEGVKKEVNRSWTLDNRPPYPAATQLFKDKVVPGKSFSLGLKEMGKLLSETIDVLAMISTTPPINVAEHVSRLHAYPYGCLEQTTSGIFPHVILSTDSLDKLGLKREIATKTDEKLRIGIQRLMEKQKSSGGFGLWSAKDQESYWLTCYVVDFLLHARQAGYEVPENALANAIQRLKTYVRRPASIRAAGYYSKKEYQAAVRVYAAFVLARGQGISLGDTRSLYQSVKKDLTGSLGYVHAGLALILSGDEKQGKQALKEALAYSRNERVYHGDYGSNIRDFASAYYLISTFYPEFDQTDRFMFLLQDELDDRQWLSTQERNSLVLAGSVSLNTHQDEFKAKITQGDDITEFTHAGFKQFASLNGRAANGFEIENTGKDDLYVSISLMGYPESKPSPAAKEADISRRFLSLEGKPLNKKELSSLKSGDRLLVELSFEAERRLPNALVVDLLPAGLELEDPNLSGSTLIDDIIVDKKTIDQWQRQYDIRHTEYRDDRFVAAVNISSHEDYRIFYPVRVVSPGEFIVPPPMIEDMYKPYVRGVGDTIPLIKVTQP